LHISIVKGKGRGGLGECRGTLTGLSSLGLGLDLLVVGGLTAIIFALGSYLFSKIEI
jgi:hypothetical protein